MKPAVARAMAPVVRFAVLESRGRVLLLLLVLLLALPVVVLAIVEPEEGVA